MLCDPRRNPRYSASMEKNEEKLFDLLRHEIGSFRDGVRDQRVTPQIDLARLREHLRDHYDFAKPLESEGLFEDVSRWLREGTVHVTHPRYFGLFNPAVTVPSIVGDGLAALYNPQLAAWSHAPFANEMERHVLGVLAERIGFDPSATQANFTTGGAEANQTAVIVAAVRGIPGFETSGVGGADPVIYVSEESHHSFHKTAVMCGLGARSIRTIPVDTSFRMDVEALENAVVEDRKSGRLPLFVVGTAGTTSAGTVDPLSRIATVCEAEGVWFHVDAAWGGSYLLVPELRPVFEGIERADSVTWDAHKGLSVPMGAGMFFCRHPKAVMNGFGVRTAYMPGNEDDTTDPYSSTVQWTRRAIGLKVFFSLAALGVGGYAEMLRRQAAMGGRIRERLRSDGWTVINETPLPVVCFTRPSLTNDVGRHTSIAAGIQNRGRVWISHTVLGGRVAVLRACVTSFETNDDDVDALIEEIAKSAS